MKKIVFEIRNKLSIKFIKKYFGTPKKSVHASKIYNRNNTYDF